MSAIRPFDADQHYYEVEESFTRHMDPALRRRGFRFVRSGKRVELRPKNPTYRPIVPKELRILGKVIEVRRRIT